MAESPTEGEPTDLPEAIAAPPHRWAPSIVWLVPIVAAAIGAWLAVHALLERDTPEPSAYVTARLDARGIAAQVHDVPASLEDVFVAATGFRHSPLEPAQG